MGIKFQTHGAMGFGGVGQNPGEHQNRWKIAGKRGFMPKRFGIIPS
jgi:hypothetical protein